MSHALDFPDVVVRVCPSWIDPGFLALPKAALSVRTAFLVLYSQHFSKARLASPMALAEPVSEGCSVGAVIYYKC